MNWSNDSSVALASPPSPSSTGWISSRRKIWAVSARFGGSKPLPTVSPIHWGNFNYTVVAVVVVLGFAWIYWMVSAKNWFKGPKVQGSAEELAAIERELSV